MGGRNFEEEEYVGKAAKVMSKCVMKRTKRSGKMTQLLFTPSAVSPASNPSRGTGYPIRIMWFSSFALGKFVHSASSRVQSPFATDQSPTSRLSTSYSPSAYLNKSHKSTISTLSRTGSPGTDQDSYFPPTQRCYNRSTRAQNSHQHILST